MTEVLLFPFPKSEPALSKPPDWLEREKALEIRQSWIVEAPAGSGKTGLLIQRYLKLLTDENVTDPGQVLAITFTTKATAELRERVMAQLDSSARGLEARNAFDRETRHLAEAVLKRNRLLGWDLLTHPRRLAIRTIDSVCSAIAHSLPVLSGSGGGQAPVADATELYREAARRTLMLLGGEDLTLSNALETLLLHRDGNLVDCEKLLAEMLAWRDQWGELMPLGKSELDDTYLESVVLPKLQKTLEQAVCRGLTRLARALPGHIQHELAVLAGDMATADGYKGAESPLAICRGLKTAPGEAAEDLAHWRALIHLLITPSSKDWRGGFNKNHVMFEITPAYRTELKRIVEQLRGQPGLREALCNVMCLPPTTYPLEQWAVTKALFRILSQALIELQIVFAARDECDFAEMGLLAKVALRQNAALDDLKAALGMELRHLLVDEMQDTSTSQYELIELLTQSWDGQSQTLFLVGDPKQSIYLFRQARVERFVRTMRVGKLGDVPIGCLRLTANFRSQRGLVEALNQDFSLLFPKYPDGERPEEVPYVEAAAVREVTAANGLVWHAHVLPYSADPQIYAAEKRVQRKEDAREIRRIAEQWRSRSLPPERSEPWQIAVLVRSRAHLVEVVAGLKQKDATGEAVPFRAVEIEVLGERQEILDLFALTRALLHPADRVAWLALLRAPWCGLTLVDLHLLAGQDDVQWAKRSLVEVIVQRGHELSSDGCARLERLWTVMQAAAAQRGRLPVSQWVERTWRSLGADAFATNEEMGNVQRYLRLLDELEEPGGVVNVPMLKQRLTKLYAEASVHPGAVDLMTIHGAKGLEWDVVIVPSLERTGQSSRGRLLAWMEIDGGNELSDDQVAHGILAPIASRGGASNDLNQWMKSIEAERDTAERKRLFYVACTRAREELHLFGAPTLKKEGDISVPSNTLLSSAWPAVNGHFTFTPSIDVLIAEEQGNHKDVGQTGPAYNRSSQARPLQRLPLKHEPSARCAGSLKLPYGNRDEQHVGARFERPDGSFASRAFGNAVHAFLDLLAARVAEGKSSSELLAELPAWQVRITAVLRASGLSAEHVDRFATRVLLALSNTLRDKTGQWVIRAHPEAASELALVSFRDSGRSSIRLDRTFHAAEEPLMDGTDFFWIVDYKTATHGREGVENFLAHEREKYAGQMESYARELRTEGRPIRVGLYYPLVPRLVWWKL